MNGRVYDPNIGRFLSVDPVFEFPTNTQSLNPYSYVLNNPLSLTDPTGYAAATCPTGTSFPADNQPGTTVTEHVSYTPTGSHIAISGTLTAKSDGNGGIAVTASNKALAQTFSAGAKAMFGGDNGQQNSQQGAHSLYKTIMSQGGGTSPAAQSVPTNPTDSTSNQTTQQQPSIAVLVEQVKGEGVNVADHAVISVNGATPVGLVPDSDKAAVEALGKEIVTALHGTPEASPVPGHVEPLAKGQIVEASAIFRVTPNQAGAMQAAIIRMENSHQIYDSIYRNCDAFVEEALRAGGVKAPNDITPRGLVSDLRKQFPQ